MTLRIGQGYDVHQLVPGRPLILGGVTIPFEKGLLGHSDADALLHAITDALLGAAALGDIGTHFPDTAAEHKNADSRALLRQAYRASHGTGLHYLIGAFHERHPLRPAFADYAGIPSGGQLFTVQFDGEPYPLDGRVPYIDAAAI